MVLCLLQTCGDSRSINKDSKQKRLPEMGRRVMVLCGGVFVVPCSQGLGLGRGLGCSPDWRITSRAMSGWNLPRSTHTPWLSRRCRRTQGLPPLLSLVRLLLLKPGKKLSGEIPQQSSARSLSLSTKAWD